MILDGDKAGRRVVRERSPVFTDPSLSEFTADEIRDQVFIGGQRPYQTNSLRFQFSVQLSRLRQLVQVDQHI